MTTDPYAQRKIDWWNIGLWAAQIALALVFGASGVMKLTQPIDSLAASMEWVAHAPAVLVWFIGFAELAGAIGMILPVAPRILPRLTPLAALGFATIQVLAIGVHASLGDLAESIPLNLVLLSLSVFVIWGRTREAVVKPRL